MHTYHDPKIKAMAKVAYDLNAFMSLTYLAATYANLAIDGIVAASTTFYLSIHNSTGPSNTGANELIAGTAYTAVGGGRPPITFGAASSGVQVSNDTQTFAMLVTESGGIGYFGIWTAASSGTYICGGVTSGLSGSIPATASVVFTNGVTLSVQG